MPNFIQRFLSWIIEKTKSHNGKFKFFAVIFPGLGAVILVFLKDPVLNSSKLAIQYFTNTLPSGTRANYSINWIVIFYYFLLFIWLFAYVIFILNESNTNKESIAKNAKSIEENKTHLDEIKNEISSAIHNAPNPDIFDFYKLIFDKISELLQTLEFETKNSGASVELFHSIFLKVLAKVCELTKRFSKKSDAIYGANIMIYIHADPSTLPYIQLLKNDEEGWPYYRGYEIDFFRGVLYSIPELIFKGDDNRIIKPVTLPIFIKPVNGKEILLPGGPFAAQKGESIIDKVGELTLSDQFESGTAQRYFSTSGKNIKSIVSIRMSASQPPAYVLNEKNLPIIVGVLNIDCDKEYLICENSKYYTTYFALLKPIVKLLTPYIEEYLVLTSVGKIKIDN